MTETSCTCFCRDCNSGLHCGETIIEDDKPEAQCKWIPVDLVIDPDEEMWSAIADDLG